MKCNDLVIIKSYPGGISLLLDEEADFNEIINEIEKKFSEARNFFGTTSVALSIENRKVSPADEVVIIDTIKKNSDIKVLCIIGKDEESEKTFVKALSEAEERLADPGAGQFFKGSLKNKEVIETENSIIILGDVYPGCAVISAKNIIILGGLYGEAYAGGNGHPDAFVAALEMEPEKIKIGDFKYKAPNKQSKWSIRQKVQPKIAYIKNDKIIFEAFTKELLSSF